MDPRRAIFKLWTDPQLIDKRKLVEEHLSRNDLRKAVLSVGHTDYRCGICNLYHTINIYTDLVWDIATCPEKYLYESEVIVCSTCMGYLIEKEEMITIAVRMRRKKYINLIRSVPRYSMRYVYNPLRNYYIPIDYYFSYDEIIEKSLYTIVFRAECPSRNPFFQIDNTLFDILSVTIKLPNSYIL